jgi:glycolate oxidase FAD binding subunit
MARSTSIKTLADLMTKVVAAPLSLEAMQLRTEDSGFALDIQLASEPAALAVQEQHLQDLSHECTWSSASPDIWTTRQQLFNEPTATVLKITSLPTKLATIAAGIALLNTQPGIRALCVAESAGVLTAAISASPEALVSLIDDLRSCLRAQGGSVVVLRRGTLPISIDTWGDPPVAIEVMRAIKREFDPQRLLNPGRFVGGI